MSKDKGGKNIKKAASTGAKKPESDYQNGKKSVSKTDLLSPKKK
jgi:hypothetical protein